MADYSEKTDSTSVSMFLLPIMLPLLLFILAVVCVRVVCIVYFARVVDICSSSCLFVVFNLSVRAILFPLDITKIRRVRDWIAIELIAR